MAGYAAFVFEGKNAAGDALDTLAAFTPTYVWVDDVAVVSRGKLGVTHVHSTWAQDDSAVAVGGSWGLLTGALIGALLGPGGAMAGAAAGGYLGVLGGGLADIAVNDPRLDELAVALGNDTSALILVGEDPTLAAFRKAADSLGGKLIEGSLSPEDVLKLRKELKATN